MSAAAQPNYVLWGREIVRGACTLSGMTGYADDWKLNYGHRVADEFPKSARFDMDPDYPRNIGLTDDLRNIDSLIVASQMCRIVKTEITSLDRLVIDESRIPPGRLLFRPKNFHRVILVHRDIAQRIDAACMTGPRWFEWADYSEV